MTLFLSWSGQYAREIAEALKDTIDQLCASRSGDALGVRTWLSAVDMEAGAKWRDELQVALSDASIGIVVVTQDAMHSHWLAYEAGALLTRCRRMVILLADAPPTLLPDPLKEYQHATLASKEMARLLKNLARDLDASEPSSKLLETLDDAIRAIRERYTGLYVTSHDDRWKGKLERPFAISEQRLSPYDLEELLKITRHRAVLVAQNHYFMTKTGAPAQGDAKFWPLVERVLLRGVDIDLIAMHADATPPPFPKRNDEARTNVVPPDALALWADYMRNPEFLRHTEEMWRTLREWDGRYRELHRKSAKTCGVLRLWTAYLTPVTMSFTDPDHPHGLVVVSPRMSHEASNSRPQFIVKKATCPDTFRYYWGTVDNGFDNGGWRLWPEPATSPAQR